MSGTPCRTRVELFAKSNLLDCQVLVAVDRCPGRGGVAAAQVLLIDRLVAGAAVGGGHTSGDDEAVMVVAFLSVGGLMAFRAVDLLARMNAQFVFVDDRILQVGVALGALARGAHEFGS